MKTSQKYHIILCDELGDEFSIELFALDTLDAVVKAVLDYPESGILGCYELKPYQRED